MGHQEFTQVLLVEIHIERFRAHTFESTEAVVDFRFFLQ